MPSLTTHISDLMMTPPVVKRLMGFQANPAETPDKAASLAEAANSAGHNKLCEKAIRALVKKLKKTPGALDELERAITTRDPNTKCITIPLKATPQQDRISRKALPHVVYCRIWRFPDLQNCNELKSLPNCQHGYHHHHSHVNDSAIICINPYHYTRCEQNQRQSPSLRVPSPPADLVVYVPKVDEDSRMKVDYSALTQYNAISLQQPQAPTNVAGSTQNASSNRDSYHSSNSPLPHSPPISLSPMDLAGSNINRSCSPSVIEVLQQASSLVSEDDTSQHFDKWPSPFNKISSLIPVAMTRQPYWCSMSYYEMKQRVGEMFHVASNVQTVTIDGYTHPSSASRFCLGVLSNANRTDETELTRRYIGRGLVLHYENGEVYAKCDSENPVFVQSANCNQGFGWHLATVLKIPPGCSLKIFDEAAFVQLANETVYQGFEAVYALTRICSIRISFVKGWGESYRRQTVLNTPCWIELHLNNPLKLVDEILTKIGSPRTICTSVS